MFTDQERAIFGPYRNGKDPEEVWADPAAVRMELLHALDGNPRQILKDRYSEIEDERYQAVRKLHQAAVDAFALSPFDPRTGQGMLLPEVIALLDRFLEFLGAKKQHRRLADWVSACRCCPYPLDFDEWFGVYLNIGRIRLQHAGETAMGVGVALSTASLPPAWFDAQALEESQTKELRETTNLDRAEARFLGRKRR